MGLTEQGTVKGVTGDHIDGQAGDLLAGELRHLDERFAALLDRIEDLPDRRRGAHLVREALEVIRVRGSHAAAVRLHILLIVDETEEPDLDTLVDLLSPEGERITRQAASKLRRKALRQRDEAQRRGQAS
jgi:hypothetical protein